MRHIYEISNEGSPGTKENWYEVYMDCFSHLRGDGTHVATFYTRDELDIYLCCLNNEYEIIPYHEPNE